MPLSPLFAVTSPLYTIIKLKTIFGHHVTAAPGKTHSAKKKGTYAIPDTRGIYKLAQMPQHSYLSNTSKHYHQDITAGTTEESLNTSTTALQQQYRTPTDTEKTNSTKAKLALAGKQLRESGLSVL